MRKLTTVEQFGCVIEATFISERLECNQRLRGSLAKSYPVNFASG